MTATGAQLSTGSRTKRSAAPAADRLRRSVLAPVIERAARARRSRALAVRMALRFEGGMFWSATARSLMAEHFGVSIGAYSYGECFMPGALPSGTTVGRYVSMAAGVRAFVRNHPMERLSLHPFFYNHNLGFVDHDMIDAGSLEIGHESWIGERAILTPGCHRVGIGAVVGAGSVVTKDVPDFAIVGGNPAKLIRFRFDQPLRELLLGSRWWERSIDELLRFLPDLLGPAQQMGCGHPLLQPHK